jgi:hypothetical protein
MILCVGKILFSQKLPELPMKNGFIFFDTTISVDSKKCLLNYIIPHSTFREKISHLSDSIEIARYKKYLKGNTRVFRIHNTDIKSKCNCDRRKCIDTASFGLTVNYPLHKTIRSTGQLMLRELKQLFGVKEELSNGFKCQVFIYCSEKKEYRIVFKGFEYSTAFIKDGKIMGELIPLDDLYVKTKEEGLFNQDQINFYNDIKYIVNEVISNYNSCLIRSIKIDEL